MHFCFTVDDVALDGYSSEKHLENILAFCRREQLKATFFVVPRPDGAKLSALPGYIRLLKLARAEGHENTQHGLEHQRFECGIPPPMVLSLPHEKPARERLAKHRREIEALHTVEKLRKMLRTGRDILEDVLEEKVRGFRTPCFSKCTNLYRALEAEGYEYDSSHVLQEAAWEIWNGAPTAQPRSISRRIFDSFQTGGRLRCIPLCAEYAWYLKKNQYEAVRTLAEHDFDACLKAEIPFVSLCHVSPLQQGDDDLGFTLFHQLLAFARERASAQKMELVCTTLSEAAASLRQT